MHGTAVPQLEGNAHKSIHLPDTSSDNTGVAEAILRRSTPASNFQTRERANSSLNQNDTKMISEVFIKAVLNGSLTA